MRDRIVLEVNRRILTPYLTEHFWWMGNGDEEMNNWTPWCTQNVLLCAFALPFEESVRRRVIEQACRSLDCFLKDYGEDGCCSEGAQYYGHAARRAGLPVCRAHREPRDGRIAAGALGEILCEGLTEAPRVEVLSIQDARLRLAWPDTLYRLVLPFSDRISIRIH